MTNPLENIVYNIEHTVCEFIIVKFTQYPSVPHESR